MLFRIFGVGLIITMAGCQAFGPPQLVSARPQPPADRPAPADPEMAELMALLGQMTPPRGSTHATPVNIRQHSFQSIGRDADPSVDPSGRWIVFASTAYSKRSDIFVKTLAGRALTQLTNDPASDIQPVFSPDGKRVAFASNRSGSWEIYVVDLDGNPLRQVTQGGGDSMHPSWSRDGSQLVYSCRSDRSRQWDMWIVDLASPSSRQYLGEGLFPVWSPTANVIAYQRARQRDKRLYGIWSVHLVNGEPSMPTLVASSPEVAYVCPTFSSDGAQLAFTAVSPGSLHGSADIYCVDVDGGRLQKVTTGFGKKFGPEWVGDRIYFSYNRGGNENIWSVRVEGAPEESLSAKKHKSPVVAKN